MNTTSNSLNQARKNIEEAEAIEKLNMIWGLRAIFDIFCIVLCILFIVDSSGSDNEYTGLVFIFPLMLFVAELYAIYGYFTKKAWSILPLHLFSAISLFNFPVGTVLSIIHYLNARKLQFE